jgi:hypothetical protein
VRLIADRVAEPRLVEDTVQLALQQTEFPGSIHWDPLSVAQGDVGQALLAAQLAQAFPEANWAAIANDHFARAVRALQVPTGLQVSAVSGISGMAFVGRRLPDGDRWQSVLTRLDGLVAQASLGLAAKLHGQSGTAVSTFDLISGLSGVVATLLPAAPAQRTPPAVPFLVRALCRLALADDGLPAWHTPVHLLYDERQMQLYPAGNLNCGLAHGIPGPLSALALTLLSGYEPAEIRPAIRRLAQWLVDHQCRDDDGPGWSAVVPLQREAEQLVVADVGELSRDAWCYGTPGVARALYLAGRALGDQSLCDLAIDAMAAVYRRPPEARGIDSPTFCHGVAGLLQITLRFAHDTDIAMFDRATADLTDQILARIDPDRPMAIATVEPGGNLVDQPGLLDGATGVCLVLLGAATDREPTWDRLFGLE